MLTILGKSTRFCDGVSRRSFLRIGTFAFGAYQLSLRDLFQAQARAGIGTSSRSHKAVINIFLGGGPPHQDMWEIKTEAPAEIRGEFKPIATKVPGLQIGECFPKIAAMADRFAFIRSVVGARGGHDAYQCMTGWDMESLKPFGGRPSIGAVVSRLQGPTDPSVPPFVGLAAPTQHRPWSDPGAVGFLGPTYSPFKPDGPGLANMTINGLNKEHLADRKTLHSGFDKLRRDIDVAGAIQGFDSATERALNVLTSNKLLDALDLSKESPRVREMYGDGKPYKFQYDGAPTVNDQLLMARRLVEAGVRVVTLTYGRWDSHGKNFDLVRDHGSKLDQGVTALVRDLEARGMLNDVAIVVWGEFGRTPRINKDAGRDHWPQVSCALMAGGGMKTGQAIGATNRLGEYAVARPVQFSEVVATLYYCLGLDPMTTTVPDHTGRPQHLAEKPVMRELV
jgi:hypothetical protein